MTTQVLHTVHISLEERSYPIHIGHDLLVSESVFSGLPGAHTALMIPLVGGRLGTPTTLVPSLGGSLALLVALCGVVWLGVITVIVVEIVTAGILVEITVSRTVVAEQSLLMENS